MTSPLVESFIRTANERFAFLAADHGLAVTVKVVEEQWATVRHAGPGLVVLAEYGDDRDHCLNVIVGRPVAGRSDEVFFGLWEWLEALGVRERRMTGMPGLWTPEAIDRVARDAAAALADALPLILAAGADVVERIEARREADRQFRMLPADQQRTR